MDERRYMVRIERGDNPIMDYDLLTRDQAYSLYDMCLKYEDCGEEFIFTAGEQEFYAEVVG